MGCCVRARVLDALGRPDHEEKRYLDSNTRAEGRHILGVVHEDNDGLLLPRDVPSGFGHTVRLLKKG